MSDFEALRAEAQAAANGSNEEVFEEEVGPKPGKTAHHIRANSSIMHLNKILVANRGEIPIRVRPTNRTTGKQVIADC
ncbi:hypothetical protein ANO14919_124030 [Xylariales sp. No.14919]|nr:hypothetical protein ANO14919_124030 [Xylariales sp. No.14919]